MLAEFFELVTYSVYLPLALLIFMLVSLSWKSYSNSQKDSGSFSLSYSVPPDLDLQNQSKILPGPENVRCSVSCKNGQTFAENYDKNVSTIFENFLHGLKVSGDGLCLGTRAPGPQGSYEWLTYEQVLSRAQKFGAGLQKLGIEPGQSTFVGIYSQNRWEWEVTALACTSQSMVIVPLYDTLGVDSAAFIVDQASIELIVCDTMKKMHKLMENIGKMPALKYIVVMDYISNGDDASNFTENSQESTATVKLLSFGEIVDSATECTSGLLLPPKPDDLYIVCYTSGTTGDPKGAMLTHRNLLTQISVLRGYFDYSGIALLPHESIISYLPLAHLLGQILHMFSISYGASIGFFRGDVSNLFDDVRALKPAYLPAVPRLLNRLHNQVCCSIAGSNPIKRALFRLAFRMKSAEVAHGIIRRDTFWDWLVFGKIQRLLGGRVRTIVTVSAPIFPEVKQFLWVTMGSCIMEAYGQTETCGAITATWPNDTRTGHVGACLPNCLVKIVADPEMDHNAQDGTGEICVKGPCTIGGYFKDPLKTHELIDDDGWLHTGDVGAWTPEGTLRIIDRKKDILKLSQGEYVSPEKIETVYNRCPLISQIFVDGRSLESFLVAVVFPDAEALKVALSADPSSQGFGASSDSAAWSTSENFSHNGAVEAFVLKKITAIGKENGLNSLEQVKALCLTPEPFTVENGLLTPTLKMRRIKLRQLFKNEMDELYSKMQMPK